MSGYQDDKVHINSHEAADWSPIYSDIFLRLELPDYDLNKSQFEGKVYLNDYWFNKPVSLAVSQGANKLTITPDRTVSVEWLTLAPSSADKAVNEFYDYQEKLGKKKSDKEEHNWQIMRQMMQGGE